MLQNEYLAAENRILRAHMPTQIRLSDPERSTLAEIGKRLGRAALQQVTCVAKPDTILAWYRRLTARKFDGSKITYLTRTAPHRARTGGAQPERILYRVVAVGITEEDRGNTTIQTVTHQIGK